MSRSYALTKQVQISVFFAGSKVKTVAFQQGPIIFGRERSCQVSLDYPFISRHHCQIQQEGGKFFLQDLKSRNGFVIDGKPSVRQELTKNLEFNIEKLTVQIEFLPLQDEIELSENTIIERLPKKNFVRVTLPNQKGKPAPRMMAHGGILSGNFQSELTEFHPGVLQSKAQRLEAVVIWHDQVVQVKEFEHREKVTIGPSPLAELQIASLHKNWNLAQVDFKESSCQVLQGMPFRFRREGQMWSGEELLQQNLAKAKGKRISFAMKPTDVVDVELGHGMKLYLRYIPATKKLTTRKLTEPDIALKRAAIGSALIHVVLGFLLIFTAPKPKAVPQLKNVPERFARLLVEPPQSIIPLPTPPPPAPEPPPPPEVAKKEPPRKQEIIKPVAKAPPKKQPKQLAKQNQFPMKVRTPEPSQPPKVVSNSKTSATSPNPPPPKAVKVESLGALAALGAGPSNTSEALTNNIKIEQSTGGSSSKMINTSGLSSALPSPSGKLMAGGGAGGGAIKMGGGKGAGGGYGTQGLRGIAGSRGVKGGVVGTPKLSSGGGGKSEGLTRQQVMDVVQKQLAEIQHCYEKSLVNNAGLQGRMEFEWDIEPKGTVSAVRVKKSSVSGGDSLGECVKDVFRAMKFPVAKNGQSTTPSIGFPFGRM